MVRCSVTCNTIPRMLEAYNKLMKHLANQSTSMKKARVKNGFLYPESKGYRDIKVNVVFESEDGTRMICEIQLIYGQNLNEKKRSHRYYHLTRDRAFFDGVVQKDDGTVLDPEQFEPVLNVKDDVETGVGIQYFVKCAVNSELQMLFMKTENVIICVNVENKKVVFRTEAHRAGHHTHHWLNMDGRQVLSVNSSKNIIKFFGVSDDGEQFLEDESLRITLSESDKVNYCEFDKKLENVYLVKNEMFLEQRTMSGDHGVLMTLKLEEKVQGRNAAKQLCLSDDGRWCVIGSGWRTKYWFLIDTVSQTQFKLQSMSMIASTAPCFIGVGSDRVIIGGNKQFEIWDVNTRSSLQCIGDIGSYVCCTVSVGNIVAVAIGDGVLRLYDAETWNVLYFKKFDIEPYSLHLTADQKYLTVAGKDGEQCVVMKLFK